MCANDANNPYSMSDEELERLLTEIDNELKEQGVPIPHRELKATLMMAVRIQADLYWGAQGYYGADHDKIINTIRSWFKKRYDNLMIMSFLIGDVALLLNKDIWIMSIPHVVQNARFYTEPLEKPVPALGEMPNGGRHNIIDYIKTMPMGIRQILTSEELLYIRDIFILGLNLFTGLKEIQKQQNLSLIKEANIDYSTSVHHLQAPHPNFGQSKWSSLQATEKMYKAYIGYKGHSFERVHNLFKLDEVLNKIQDRPLIESQDLKAIQASPSVRYGEVSVSKDEALEAHHSSLKVGEILLRGILGASNGFFGWAPVK